MADPIVTTLEIQKGKKYDENGEVIASYGRSIVFLPKNQGLQPGQEIRAKLVEQGVDRGGRPMYRAEPAPDEIIERWRDNGDGTVSKIKIAKNWLLQESTVEVITTRPFGKREAIASIKTERKVVFDPASLVDSYIKETRTQVIPSQEEYLGGDILMWKTISEREEPDGSDLFPIEAIKGFDWDWDRNHLNPQYGDANIIALQVRFTVKGSSTTLSHKTTWGTLPVWLQNQLLVPYSRCSCGRQRIDPAKVTDGYAKCEFCRAEEKCKRCGKKSQSRMTMTNGRFICDDCKPYQVAEDLIHQLLPAGRLQDIADEAKRLRSAQVLPKEAGEVILRATVGHVSSSWTSDSLLQKWSGYGWYYFADDGVYGTKFSPEALAILEFLPRAQGNGLVELIAWFAGKLKNDSSDYFSRTQINHEVVSLPSLDSVINGLAGGNWGLADRLRGAEEDRITALAGYQTLVAKLGEYSKQAKAVAETLQGDEQDYAKAAALIHEYERREKERQEAAARGEIWMDVRLEVSTESRAHTDVFCIASDGSIIQPQEEKKDRYTVSAYVYGDLLTTSVVISHGSDDYGYRFSEWWKVNYLPGKITDAQRQAVKRLETRNQYFSGPEWNLDTTEKVLYTTAYSRDMQGEDREAHDEQSQSFPIDVRDYELWIGEDPFLPEGYEVEPNAVVIGPYKHRDPQSVRLRQLQEQLEQFEIDLEQLEADLKYSREEYEKAELAALERLDAAYGTRSVADGDVFEVIFKEEEHEQRKQLVAGPVYDEPSASWIKFVLDPFQSVQPPVGGRCLIRVRAKNSQQTHLFAYRIENPEGKHGRGGRMITVFGYFAQPILGEDYYQQKITEVEAEIAKIETEIELVETEPIKMGVKVQPEPEEDPVWVDESSEEDNTMLEAFRRAQEKQTKKRK